jgi:hypothetical protein
MDAVLLSTPKGAPIAVLLMSQPGGVERDCIFTVAARDVETYNSAEGQTLLPGKPTACPCKYSAGRSGTVIEFRNRTGW